MGTCEAGKVMLCDKVVDRGTYLSLVEVPIVILRFIIEASGLNQERMLVRVDVVKTDCEISGSLLPIRRIISRADLKIDNSPGINQDYLRYRFPEL